jgi:hypothetical protein
MPGPDWSGPIIRAAELDALLQVRHQRWSDSARHPSMGAGSGCQVGAPGSVCGEAPRQRVEWLNHGCHTERPRAGVSLANGKRARHAGCLRPMLSRMPASAGRQVAESDIDDHHPGLATPLRRGHNSDTRNDSRFRCQLRAPRPGHPFS